MRKEFNFKQSQSVLENIRKEELSADSQVKIIIEKLNIIQDNYQSKIYKLLTDIIKIRRRNNKSYGVMGLSREKGMKLSRHQISYILNYKYLTQFALKMIDTGRLETSTCLWLIRKSAKFKEPQNLDKLIKLYITGKLKTTEISTCSSDVINHVLITDKMIEKVDKHLINFSNYLFTFTNLLKAKKDLFSDYKLLNKIHGQLGKMQDEIEDIYKKGNNVKKSKEKDGFEEKKKRVNNNCKFLDDLDNE